MTANPWTKFFWSDWETDPGLKLSSLAAQGLWMRMLCICAKAEPIGYLKLNGRSLKTGDIARAVGDTPDTVQELLDELEMNGVFSKNSDGIIYSRRLVKDEKKRKKLRENASSGGKASVRNKRGIFGTTEQNHEQESEQSGEQLFEHGGEQAPEPQWNHQSPESRISPKAPPLPDDGGKTIDRIRQAIWRLHGLTEDQIATKLSSASREGLEQVVRWLKAGWTESEVVELATSSYDAAEQASKPIRNPWTYLDAAVKARANPQSDPAPASPPEPAEPLVLDSDPARWRGRLDRFKNGSGFWAKGWGPKPGEAGCLCPPEILAEFGYAIAA